MATQAFLLASTAVAVGALFGRAVPTFLLGLILGMLTIVAVGLLHRESCSTRRSSSGRTRTRSTRANDLYLDNRLELPDGRLVTYEELIRIDPAAFESEFGPQYPNVALLIPGDRYRTVEAREAAGHRAGASALRCSLGVAAVACACGDRPAPPATDLGSGSRRRCDRR